MSPKVLTFSKNQDGSSAESPVHNTGVDLGGLMMVLGKHLYSTPIVALRELVQNAHDSLIRRRIEDSSFNASEQGARITVTGDFAKSVICITDSGAGLTPHEIHTYLATVGVGYTRTLREKNDDSGLIGMFGLGFLSAFVLASEVTVTTTSHQTPDEGWRYRSLTGETYTLEEAPARPVGTEIRLVLREEFAHLAGQDVLRAVLAKYCALLREPVFLNEEKTALNPEEPPWRLPEAASAAPPVWLHRKQMEFAERFDRHFSPLCVMPIAPQPGDERARAAGLLWVQDSTTYGTSDNRQLSVFSRGMLLNDDARDLLPNWAGFISGVIESDSLSPTASREDLQKDEAYHAAKHAIAEALINGLAGISRRHPEAWRRVLSRHNDALLGASLCDDRLFELLADSVLIRTSQGELPAAGLRTAAGAIHVRLGSQGGFEDMLFRVLRTPVARGELYAIVPFLRRWVDLRGGTLVELGTDKGNRSLFTRVPLPEEEIRWLTDSLGHGEDVIPARFMPEELPLVVVRDREAELKKRLEQDDADKRISFAALRLARNYTAEIESSAPTKLYVNVTNPAVRAILEAKRNQRPTKTAVTLLRSLKILMAAGSDAGEAHNVNAALEDFCRLVASL